MSRELVFEYLKHQENVCRPKNVSRETFLVSAPSGARETFNKLETYVSLLIKWQKVQNLISPTTLETIWERHIYDSLQLLPHLEGETAVDFGTGAGLPGLVLAICKPEMRFDLVESNQRKCAFLHEAARQTETKVNVLPIRAEDYKGLPHICMARAMTALPELLALAQPIVNNGGYALFPKGKSYQEELTLAVKTFNINYENVSWSKNVSRAPEGAETKNVSRETFLGRQTFSKNETQSVILKITKIESRQ